MLSEYIYDYVLMHECASQGDPKIVRAVDEILYQKTASGKPCEDTEIYNFAVLVILVERPQFDYIEWKGIYVRVLPFDLFPEVSKLKDTLEEEYKDHYAKWKNEMGVQ